MPCGKTVTDYNIFREISGHHEECEYTASREIVAVVVNNVLIAFIVGGDRK